MTAWAGADTGQDVSTRLEWWSHCKRPFPLDVRQTEHKTAIHSEAGEKTLVMACECPRGASPAWLEVTSPICRQASTVTAWRQPCLLQPDDGSCLIGSS